MDVEEPAVLVQQPAVHVEKPATPPAPPSPPIPTSFPVQLLTGGMDNLSIPLGGSFLGFSIEMVAAAHIGSFFVFKFYTRNCASYSLFSLFFLSSWL